jgi:ribonuclease T2
MRVIVALLVALGVLTIGLAATPGAAAPACRVPAMQPTPVAERAPAGEERRVMPIGGYTLAMIWAPQQCRRAVPGAKTLGCGPGTGGRRFLLHGLWPDGERGSWPQWCRTAGVLPAAVIRANWCATPSSQLQQHEWAKHGTCVPGATPAKYLGEARALFERVRTPDMVTLSRRDLTRDDLARAIARANPGLPMNAVKVRTDRDGWLEEVWLCLDRRRTFTRCGEADRAGDPVRIWRGRA